MIKSFASKRAAANFGGSGIDCGQSFALPHTGIVSPELNVKVDEPHRLVASQLNSPGVLCSTPTPAGILSRPVWSARTWGFDLENNDEFVLYDLKVEVVLDGRQPVCRHIEGEFFTVEGENLVFSGDQKVSMYALAALLPLLPAKQRDTDPNDWMSTDAEVACPDPHCGGRFRITRIRKRRFRHSETSGLPDSRTIPYWTKGGV